jgi:hypothetical protein
MKHRIDLNDDTSILLHEYTKLTGLSVSDLIDRLLSSHLPDLHELLALVDAFPPLRDQAANLLVSFGPQPIAQGIACIAPAGYETLCERFKREMNESTANMPMRTP